MTTYQIGETPRLEASIIDTATGAAADPTTTTINIVDPTGTTKVDNTAMTNPSTGSFYHDYPIPSDGNIGTWEWNVIATGSGGRVTIMQSSFEVEAQV
jgi:uncharacterized protein YfaS (alpha-2-macroglobulin family)